MLILIALLMAPVHAIDSPEQTMLLGIQNDDPALVAAAHAAGWKLDDHLTLPGSRPKLGEAGITLEPLRLPAAHYSAMLGKLAALGKLIELGASVEYPAHEFYSECEPIRPLHAAASGAKPGAIELLLKSGARVDQSVGTPGKKCFAQDADMFRGSALFYAVDSDCMECMDLLFKYGANPNFQTVSANGMRGFTAIHRAAQIYAQRESEVGIRLAEHLIKHGAKLEIESDNTFGTPLIAAAALGDFKITEFLLKRGAKPNYQIKSGPTRGEFALRSSLFIYPSIEVAELLLDFGANVNLADPWGETALHVAAYSGSAEGVRLLLRNGANVNPVSRRKLADSPANATPLDRAITSGADRSDVGRELRFAGGKRRIELN